MAKTFRSRVALPLCTLMISAIGLYGCTMPSIEKFKDSMKVEPLVSHQIEKVPFFPEFENMSGPAALACVTKYYGADTSQKDLERKLHLPRINGSLIKDMVRAAAGAGLRAESYNGSLYDLKSKITMNRPLILLIETGEQDHPMGRYIVATGFDEETDTITAHYGTERSKKMRIDRLIKTWSQGDYRTILIRPISGPRPTEEESKNWK